MERSRHAKIVDLMGLSKDDFEKDTVKIIMELQTELDGVKRLLVEILQKDHPEEIIKFADYLITD